MKKHFLILLFVSPLSFLAQEPATTVPQSGRNIYLSAGSHIGFWSKDGQNGMPFNMQLDLLFAERIVLGAGYTYDSYQGNPMFFNVRTRPGHIRQNINVRFYRYLSDPRKVFSTYLGCTGGISIWEVREGRNLYPSSQFLFGIKLQFTRDIFWHTEFGVGPPYICQSSIGIRFND